MRALIQRVLSASVTVNGTEKRSIQRGLLVLFGVRQGDDIALAQKLAAKCANLRIFEDDEGKMNISAVELGYSVLAVSQFTLYADTKKGKRPSFISAAKPPLSVDCYEEFIKHLKKQGLCEVQTGEFGANMQIELINDGPVTIMLDTDEWSGHIEAI